jgi:hypothetical protein
MRIYQLKGLLLILILLLCLSGCASREVLAPVVFPNNAYKAVLWFDLRNDALPSSALFVDGGTAAPPSGFIQKNVVLPFQTDRVTSQELPVTAGNYAVTLVSYFQSSPTSGTRRINVEPVYGSAPPDFDVSSLPDSLYYVRTSGEGRWFVYKYDGGRSNELSQSQLFESIESVAVALP